MDPSTILSTVGTVVSPLLQVGLDKLYAYCEKRSELLAGYDDSLRNLKVVMASLPIYARVVERTQSEHPDLVPLMRMLKDVYYDADDLLDDLEHMALEQEVERRSHQVSKNSPPQSQFELLQSQFSQFLTGREKESNSSFPLITSDVEINVDHAIVSRIDSMVDRLEKIETRVKGAIQVLRLDDKKPEVPSRQRETSSFLAVETGVIGRDRERDRMLEMLLKPGDECRSRDGDVLVVPIVGIGGVGKTTLAQYVYNDPEVDKHFKHKAWVYVSETLDLRAVLKEIVVQVSSSGSGDLHHVTSLNYIEKVLIRELKGKKILLVLDDVWKDNWSRILTLLRSSAEKGSRIIVTARNDSEYGSKKDLKNEFSLDGLEGDEFLLFFNLCAFGDRDPEDYPELLKIGKEIAQKLRGSPLAAKTVGGVLRENMDEEHWKRTRNNHIWKIRQNESDIMPALRLSYDHLSPHLQQCFSYCGILLKGHEIDKKELVFKWMAIGLIPHQKGSGKSMEDIGADYFDELLRRSFFSQTQDHIYKMHDLLHDLARFVSENECLIIQGNGPIGIPDSVCHLTVATHNPAVLAEVCKHKNLRTLLLISEEHFPVLDHLLPGLFERQKNLRVLELCCYEATQLPDSIGGLKHLRYLNLERTSIRAFPSSLCGLYHMQVLRAPHGLQKFPQEIINLLKLRHLSAQWLRSIAMLDGIGKLTFLQELDALHVRKEYGHRLIELKGMTELRELHIRNLENVEDAEEVKEIELNNKKNLRALHLEWGTSDQSLQKWNQWRGMREMKDDSPKLDENVLTCFQPHFTLEELKIIFYRGSKSPNWMENQLLPHLKSLYLIECRAWKCLPPLGTLQSLGTLHLEGMDAVEQVDVKGFQQLKKLDILHMPNLKEWSGLDGGQMLTRLLKLKIRYCPKLRELPPIPLKLEELELCSAGVIALPRLCGCDDIGSQQSSAFSSSSLWRVQIEECDELRSLVDSFLQQHLPALRTVCISDNHQLVSFPAGGFRGLISLKYLGIRGCDKLEATMLEGDAGLVPPLLSELTISDCGNLDRALPRFLMALSSLSYLSLTGCPNMTSLSAIGELMSLEFLLLHDLPELASLEGLQALTSLRILKISQCPKLVQAVATSSSPHLVEGGREKPLALSLNVLTVDDLLLLIKQPFLKNITTLRSLEILAAGVEPSDLEEWLLQNGSLLRELRVYFCPSLRSLSSLQCLHLRTLPELKSLPELPDSLQELCIRDCNQELMDKCKEDGEYWHMIAHIPNRNIQY